MTTVKEMEQQGGKWLGVMREFIQWNAANGDQVQWSSNDAVDFRRLTVKDLERLAARIALAAQSD